MSNVTMGIVALTVVAVALMATMLALRMDRRIKYGALRCVNQQYEVQVVDDNGLPTWYGVPGTVCP